MNATNQIYALWSGGLDSTYMIQYLLESNPNNVIRCSYVEILNNENKTKMELAAIDKLIPIFREKYKDRFSYHGISYRVGINNMTHGVMFYQMPLWIGAIATVVPKDINQVAIGYVMNDDAISYLSEFKEIVKAFDKLRFSPLPEIIFPLYKQKKDFITDDIFPSLKKFVVWCELPILNDDGSWRYCGQCGPCKRSPIVEGHPKNVDSVFQPMYY